MAGYSKHRYSVCLCDSQLCFVGVLCRLGDQIAAVNDTSLLNVTHADAVRILKDSDQNIELVSMLPIVRMEST